MDEDPRAMIDMRRRLEGVTAADVGLGDELKDGEGKVSEEQAAAMLERDKRRTLAALGSPLPTWPRKEFIGAEALGRLAPGPGFGVDLAKGSSETVLILCGDCDFESNDVADMLEHARRHGWRVLRISGTVER